MGDKFIYKNLEDALTATFFFVEADSFSQEALWDQVNHINIKLKKIKWEKISRGWWRQLKTTTCSFSFTYINDKLICFYSATSVMVNWDEVDEFIKPYLKHTKGRQNKCDANNFHQCICHSDL